MPKGKTKKFIDKKNSVTFHLVHRSQQDPLAADETAPQRVLVPVDGQFSKSEKKSQEPQKRIEEQQKYGIFFDDDYDYLQHLKDVNKLPVEWSMVENPNDKNSERKIKLPSSVFASDVEEKVGLLNKAAPISGPRLELDPDIVAAMDDDFDYDDPDNQLEDDFLELANGPVDEVEFDEEDEEDYESADESNVSSGHMAVSDEERDEVRSLNGPQFSFREEETKSRFTEYSMSSSVMRRNQQLTLLDDKFERMFAGYDEVEIGALDCEEIEGHVLPDSQVVIQCAEEFEKEQSEATDNVTKLLKNRLKILEYRDSSEEEDHLERLTVDPRVKDKWDCESVLSTYSNIYNHPKIIVEPKGLGKIKLHSKTGVPKDVLDQKSGKLTAKSLAMLDREYNLAHGKSVAPVSMAETMKSTLSVLSNRPKNETPEDKRERKKAIKEYRRERRLERKANSEAFKEEKKRQEKILLNNQQNVQGNRIL
ncbi:protein LTV1 homolog [Fopius arisanus]|uniref:Protein LTV1 homolog n=1 Tax=Fopius arisanus TaxID=64838 RepID=A0A0C9R3P6_9HYME|nr:PREDICTED: protein LTV1 homolog [Fopius arisanus]